MGCNLSIEEFKKKFNKAIYAGLGEVGDQVVETAKDKAPFDKGDLRDGIEKRFGKYKVYIGARAKYAKSQEFGTGIYNVNGKGTMPVGFKPQPFLRPAINKHSGQIGKTIAMEIIRGLGGKK